MRDRAEAQPQTAEIPAHPQQSQMLALGLCIEEQDAKLILAGFNLVKRQKEGCCIAVILNSLVLCQVAGVA